MHINLIMVAPFRNLFLLYREGLVEITVSVLELNSVTITLSCLLVFVPIIQVLWLQLHGPIYRPNSFVLTLRYCANLKAIRYESKSLNRIVTDKSQRVIAAYCNYGKVLHRLIRHKFRSGDL